jgi:hypothetical protein
MSDREKDNRDNHGNQCNPNNSEYKGHVKEYAGEGTPADLDNHANQCNPNNSKCQGCKAENKPKEQ